MSRNGVSWRAMAALLALAGLAATLRPTPIRLSTPRRNHHAVTMKLSTPATQTTDPFFGEPPREPPKLPGLKPDENFSVDEARAAAGKMRRDAYAAEKAGRAADAVRLLRRATALRPHDSARAWSRLARLHRLAKDWPSMRAALRRGVAAMPGEAPLWRELAEASRTAGDGAAAKLHYRRAVEAEPTLVAAWDAWARLELRGGDAAAAARLARRGLEACGAVAGEAGAKVQPDAARLWHAYGLALGRGGGARAGAANATRLAEAALRRGLRDFPRHAHLRHALGVELAGRGDDAGARRELRLAVVCGHDEALLSLARLEETVGDLPAARRAYRRACGLERAPTLGNATREDRVAGTGEHIASWLAFARFEALSAKDAGSAAALYRRASVRFPRDAELYVQWARLERDADRSREILAVALSHRPRSTRVWHALGDLEATTAARDGGDRAEASLHAARRSFYRGARASNGGADLVALVHAWAHAEWALARARGESDGQPVSRSGANRTRRLFDWALRLAARGHPDALPWVACGRARFEAFVADCPEVGDRKVAAKFAREAIEHADEVDDFETAATAWRVLARLDRDAKPARATAFAARAARADARHESTAGAAHPLGRSWTTKPPPLEERFGCCPRLHLDDYAP